MEDSTENFRLSNNEEFKEYSPRTIPDSGRPEILPDYVYKKWFRYILFYVHFQKKWMICLF